MQTAAAQPAGPLTFFHGTDMTSALQLLNGAALDAATAGARKIDGPPGFFLAAEESDAEHFAARRGRGGAVLRFELSPSAAQQLMGAGAVRRPIPTGPRSPAFAGDELHVPPGAYDLFDRLRRAGEIKVVPA